MKEINAIIHSNRIADVLDALKEADCTSVCAAVVRGLLRAIDTREQHYSVELAQAIIFEYKLELVCEDDQVERLVEIIKRNAQTGQAKAGMIYVTEVLQAIPITGERT
ncbi:P-II family nitrogen regulator [Thermithiobacillus tepidarius DSM 3134]|uniref:P-II family nitrogen regulator n=1 Tax=Thermithiobacillus tepidarius TaxID=929 RepID=UPI0004074B78|nr:P-II family nitrogen regulator [Thermithiobacillus tepidarius]